VKPCKSLTFQAFPEATDPQLSLENLTLSRN
jgi:hypothetical protein